MDTAISYIPAVVRNELSGIYLNSAKWFPYFAASGVISSIAASCLGLGASNFIDGSPFVTGALALAAFQIGWNIPHSSSINLQRVLRISFAYAFTIGFAYFTTVPILTALCLATLNTMFADAMKTEAVKKSFDAKKFVILSYGVAGGIIYEVFARTIQAMSGTNLFCLGFGQAVLAGLLAGTIISVVVQIAPLFKPPGKHDWHFKGNDIVKNFEDGSKVEIFKTILGYTKVTTLPETKKAAPSTPKNRSNINTLLDLQDDSNDDYFGNQFPNKKFELYLTKEQVEKETGLKIK